MTIVGIATAAAEKGKRLTDGRSIFKFLADENFPMPSVVLLREAGHDVQHIGDIASGVADEDVEERRPAHVNGAPAGPSGRRGVRTARRPGLGWAIVDGARRARLAGAGVAGRARFGCPPATRTGIALGRLARATRAALTAGVARAA
jgi:hypothetical protein